MRSAGLVVEPHAASVYPIAPPLLLLGDVARKLVFNRTNVCLETFQRCGHALLLGVYGSMAYRRARCSDPRDPILAIVSAFRQMSTGSDQSHRVKNGEGSMMERSAAIGRESSGRSRGTGGPLHQLDSDALDRCGYSLHFESLPFHPEFAAPDDLGGATRVGPFCAPGLWRVACSSTTQTNVSQLVGQRTQVNRELLMNPLLALNQRGQFVWLDNISRHLITGSD